MGPINFLVEETLATPQSFRFNGSAIASSHELPVSASEPWPSDVANERLVQVEQAMHFHFRWNVTGPLVGLLDRGLTWKIQLFFEKWGQSETPLSPSVTTGFVRTPGHTYNSVIAIPANTLSEGVYDVVGVIRLYNSSGAPLPVAGFVEMGKYEFYEQA